MKKLFGGVVCICLAMTNSFGIDADKKTGFFAGIDLSAATFRYSDNITIEAVAPGDDPYSLGIHNSTALNYGIKIGYQFYGSENHGVRIGAHLNMGEYSLMVKDDSKTKAGIFIDKKSSYFAFRYGIDMDYLFDFYNSENQAFGFSGGIGYEFANYTNGKTSASFSGEANEEIFSFANSLFGNGAYINLGLHYYFKEHQFEFGARLPFSVFNSNDYIANGDTQSTPEGLGDSSIVYQNVKITANASYHFSYTYRF